ncbi:Metallo-hydrolase/oxidoreductase [Trametes elegans]|nr:Metallo-hydrolase/oxidoreductase [Trametes elegans]
MALPPPSLNQPYCTVSALDGGHIEMSMDHIVDIGIPGEKVDLPDLMFLLQHNTTGARFLFDLGIRTDLENMAKGPRELIQRYHVNLGGRPDLRDTLTKGSIVPDDIKHIGISHIHFDHTGDPTLFPNATFLPDFVDTNFALDVPPERITFLSPDRWSALGPFPHAHDFYGDGSLYIIDAAGHVPGHLNLLVRTSADGGWLLLAADAVHDRLILTGEARFAHHPLLGCVHLDPTAAETHLERIPALQEANLRVRVLLSHHKPWYKENKGGPAFWPGAIQSL